MKEEKTSKPRKGRPPKSKRESLQPNENSSSKSEPLLASEPETSNIVDKDVKLEADSSGAVASPEKSDDSDTVSINGEGNCSSNTSLVEFKGPSSQSSVSQEMSNYRYEIGTRLEAKDLGNEIWYAAKVVEVDWEEEEILIHFEKWSQRYDEWIPMDSSRLRPAKARPDPPKKNFKDFKVGEKVMATWSDSRKYLAQIKAVLPNDRYEVLFYDGFTKIIRAGRISKHDETEGYDINEFQSPQMKEELTAKVSESVLNESLSPDSAADSIGTKEDRRARKRKLNFAELFHFKKRSRFDKDGKGLFGVKRGRKKHVLASHDQETEASQGEKLQTSEQTVCSGTETLSGGTLSEVTKKKRGRRRVDSEGSSEKLVKRPRSHFSESKDKDTEYKPPGRKLKLKGEDSYARSKAVTHAKGEEDSLKKEDSSSVAPAETKKAIEDEWRPEGEVAYVIGGADGPRQSIIMADDRVPEGWVKHSIQRMSGNSAGKWDVFFLSPHGKKFRTKHDLKNYYEERGEKFPVHAFDFSLRQKKAPRPAGGDTSPSGGVLPGDAGKKSKLGTGGRRRLSVPSDSEFAEQGLVQKRVKTLLPKVRLPQNEEGVGESVAQRSGTPPPYLVPADSSSPTLKPAEDAAGGVFVGGLRVQRENDAFKCPKDGCNKNFRKENLLQMHIKHYHPEYNKFMGSTPNVADLAYARTIGEPVEDIVPKSRYSVKSPAFLEKINRFEATRKVKVGDAALGEKRKVSPFKEKVATISPNVKRSLKEYLEDDKYHTGTDSLNERAALVDLGSREARDHLPSSNLSATGISEEDLVGNSELAGTGAFSPSELEDRAKSKMPTLEKMDFSNEGTEVLGTKREVESPHSLPPILGAQSKSVRTIRKKHLTDFHMEPVHRKRKPEALDKSDNTEEGLLTEGDDSGGARAPSVYHFSKKKNPTVHLEKLNVTADSNGRVNLGTLDNHLLSQIKGTEGQGETPSEEGASSVKLEHLRKEEIINCTCEVTEEDGLMIQCDLCLCWQHGICNNIEKEEDVPEKYVCQICLNPNKERLSRKYIHNQDWLKEGKLPSLSFRSKNLSVIAQRESILKRSHDLTAELVKLEQMLHHINVKIEIAGNGEHPKLILWSKTWNQKVNNSPQVKGEAQEETKLEGTLAPAPADVKVEPGTETKAEPGAEAKVEPEAETKAEPGAEAKVEPGAEAKVEPGAETQLEPEAETKAEPEAETKAEPETETKAEPEAETKAEPEAETKAEPEAETQLEHEAETKLDPKADAKVEPDPNVTLVEETEVNLGTEVEIEAEEEVVSSEDKSRPEDSAPAVEKSDSCDSVTDSVEIKVQDKDKDSSDNNCRSPTREEISRPSESVSSSSAKAPAEAADDSSAVERQEEDKDPVSRESDSAPKDKAEEEGEDEAETTETGDEDGSLLQQALDGDIQSELMQLATSIVGNLEDADVEQQQQQVLSAAKQVSAPVPEAPIDFVVCQRTLIEHIERYQQKIDERLTSLEAQLAELESQEPDLDDESPLYCPRTKQTIQMLLRDLGTVRQIASISSD